MIALRRPARGDDDGAVLILAMLFLLLTAFMVLVPLGLADVNLHSTASLEGDRSREYAARDILDATIAEYRGHTNHGAWANQQTWSGCASAGLPTFPGQSDPGTGMWNGVRLWIACRNVATAPPSQNQPSRDMEFVVCSVEPTDGICPQGSVRLSARVTFYDQSTPSGVWVGNFDMDY